MADHHSHQQSSLKRKRSPTDHAPASRIKQEDDEPVEQINRSYDQNCSSLISLLIERDRYVPILDNIYDHLGIADIVALTRVSKALSTLYTDYVSLHWNVDKHLARFVADPKALRHHMGLNRSLIVGSVPMQFFSRLSWKDSSLDILVENGPEAEAMMAYIASQGYHKYKKLDMNHLELDFEMTPFTRGDSAKSTVNLITISDSTIWAFLVGPASMTANSCFIAWDKAYCLFPQYTHTLGKTMFAAYLGRPSQGGRSKTVRSSITKFKNRGWLVSDRSVRRKPDLAEDCQLAVRELSGTRRIGDVETWSIPFDCFNLPNDRFKLDSSFIERCTFRVEIIKYTAPGHIRFKMHTASFECCMLRYRYTFDLAQFPEEDFHGHLRYVLCHNAVTQIRRHLNAHHIASGEHHSYEDVDGTTEVMNKQLSAAIKIMSTAIVEDDDDNYDESCPLLAIPNDGESFERFDGWEYADDLIPQIHEDWSKYQPYSRAIMKVKAEIKEEKED
ncbi:hypothetical protein D6D00_10577 [Aureobasidium pullulans]|nr:hypothetical protein D6D00_10577 [Aureobasidium pullulans]